MQSNAIKGFCVAFAACLFLIGVAAAQGWPSKPIVVITSGSADVAPRILGAEIAGPLGQQLIVEAHPGASGTIAAEHTLRQPADGYTVLHATSALMAAPNTFDIKYDILRDFAPVTLFATSPFVLVAHPSLPVRSLTELIALAKKHPGKLHFSATSPGSSSSVVGESFTASAGISIVQVPYRTMAAALTDVVAGQVQLGMSVGASAVAQIRAHKVRALAASTPKRSEVLPDIPTFTELGFPKVALPAWYGFLVRAGTPVEIISRLNAELVKAIRKAEIREKFLQSALDPIGDGPQEFRTFIEAELARWSEAAKLAYGKTKKERAP